MNPLYICTRYLRPQFIYPSKAKSLLIRQFYSFSMLRDHFVLHLGARRPQDLPSDGRAQLSERLEEAT